MADAVDVATIRSRGRTHVVHMVNVSDGTGESAVTKVDISALLTVDGKVPTYTVIDRIEYSVQGMAVRLFWDHTTDDEIAVLQGSGVIDWQASGGKVDPRTTGGTGDILLTTTGHSSGDTYDITIWLRLKA